VFYETEIDFQVTSHCESSSYSDYFGERRNEKSGISNNQ
jgi:hypothetical protein